MIPRCCYRAATSGSEAIDEGADLWIRPVGGADEFAADDALAVDEIRLGPHACVEEAGSSLVRVAYGDEIDVPVADEVRIGFGIFIDADSENDEVGVVMVKLEKRGQFHNAGSAPRCPEVEQNDLAAIAGEMDGAGAVGDCEVGRLFAGLQRMRSAITAAQHKKDLDQDESEPAIEPHVPIIRSGRVPAKGRGVAERENPEKSDSPQKATWKPVLGLASEGEERPEIPVRTGTVFDQPEPAELLELSVIVPARNEEDCLGACLQSLVSQSNETFKLGREWELTVVDDHSTDRTAEIARSFAGVNVLEAAKLEKGWTGKANAIWTEARMARGRWLLFTDADTVHEEGDLHRAIHEATRHKVGMLSYSPKQIVSGLWQRALMPLVFSELALAYPPGKVSDPNQRIAAANGQFLLVEREAYRRLGGHASVAGKVLEDVELAFLAKRRKVGLRFRYADDAVSTRMYRTTAAMVEGWTKNLALLFNNALVLAMWRALDIALLVGLPVLAVKLWNARFGAHSLEWLGAGWVLLLLWVRSLVRFYARVAKSNFGFANCALSPVGLPLFVVLLYRSWFKHRVLKQVSWKGRTYPG